MDTLKRAGRGRVRPKTMVRDHSLRPDAGKTVDRFASVGLDAPSTDPDADGPTGVGLGDRFADDPSVVGPEELRGLSASDAENAYIGRRRSEDENDSFVSGSVHERACVHYGQLLGLDRVAREAFDSPAVGMQTVVFDPDRVQADADGRFRDGGPVGPVKQANIVTDGADRVIRRTRDEIDRERYVYAGVRDMDASGLSHWHVYWCVDTAHVDADSLTLSAGIDSHVSATPGAVRADHAATEAVKWDPTPDRTAESFGADAGHGGPVHPCARYVAGSLPHLGSVGDRELSPREVRHGAVEWAATTDSVRRRNRNAVPADFGSLSE